MFVTPPDVPTIKYNRTFDVHYFGRCADAVLEAAVASRRSSPRQRTDCDDIFAGSLHEGELVDE